MDEFLRRPKTTTVADDGRSVPTARCPVEQLRSIAAAAAAVAAAAALGVGPRRGRHDARWAPVVVVHGFEVRQRD
jgi:hypothetical protein